MNTHQYLENMLQTLKDIRRWLEEEKAAEDVMHMYLIDDARTHLSKAMDETTKLRSTFKRSRSKIAEMPRVFHTVGKEMLQVIRQLEDVMGGRTQATKHLHRQLQNIYYDISNAEFQGKKNRKVLTMHSNIISHLNKAWNKLHEFERHNK